MTSRHKTSAALSPDCAALPGEPAAERLPGNAPSPAEGLHHVAGDGAQTPATRAVREPVRVAGQPAPGMAKLAAAMSEADLERKVRRIAADLGLRLYHVYDSRRSDPGFPDLVLVGRGVLYRELKKENGRLTTAQRAWLAALADAGQDAKAWRPSDLISGDVARELAVLSVFGRPS